jgi:hypothetical protein
MTRTAQQALDQMKALTASQSTEVLCLSLRELQGMKMGDAEKMTEAVICDELYSRHPEVAAAEDRWFEDLETTEDPTDVILAAALTAIGH